MRHLLNIVIVITIAIGLAGAAWLSHAGDLRREQRELARTELRRFQQQIALQSQFLRNRKSDQQHPDSIDPAWFEGDLPANPLLDESHPWLEVAREADETLLHPQQRIAAAGSLARFWYNPKNGTVRARVPAALSDQEALELYSFINGCDLPKSLVHEPPQ